MTDAEAKAIREAADKLAFERSEAIKRRNDKYKVANPDYNPNQQYAATAEESTFSYINRKMKEILAEDTKARGDAARTEEARDKALVNAAIDEIKQRSCVACSSKTKDFCENTYAYGHKCWTCGRKLNPFTPL